MIRRIWLRLIRLGFRLLYNELAWTYDGVSWLVSLGEWRNWQRVALPFVAGERALEIGHGPGHTLLDLAAAVPRVAGLDVSPYMGRQARRRLEKAGLPVTLARGRAQELPWAAAVFDTVLATFPTDYIIEPETIASVRRVLKADGRFLIVPEGRLTGRGAARRFIDWLFRITGQRDGAFVVDEEGFWPDTAVWEPFRQRYAAAGFTVEVRQIKLERSIVAIILAQKKRPSTDNAA